MPFSYFEIDERFMPSISASCCCERPLFFLAALKFSEKLILIPHKIKKCAAEATHKKRIAQLSSNKTYHPKKHVEMSLHFYQEDKIHALKGFSYAVLFDKSYYNTPYVKNPVFF